MGAVQTTPIGTAERMPWALKRHPMLGLLGCELVMEMFLMLVKIHSLVAM